MFLFLAVERIVISTLFEILFRLKCILKYNTIVCDLVFGRKLKITGKFDWVTGNIGYGNLVEIMPHHFEILSFESIFVNY